MTGLEDGLSDVQHGLVRRHSLDLRAQIKADAERSRDDERAVEQELPGSNLFAKDRKRSVLIQVRNGQVGFTGVHRRAGNKQEGPL